MELLESFLQIIETYEKSLFLIGGFAAGCIAIYIKLLPTLKENKAAKIKHDRRIFENAEEILNEKDIYTLLDELSAEHCHHSMSSEKVHYFLEYFGKPSNRYIDKRLFSKIDGFVNAISSLEDFYSSHFFMYPDFQNSTNKKYCMYPEGNSDRNWDGKKESIERYKEKENELRILCENAREKYDKYRIEIKNILKI